MKHLLALLLASAWLLNCATDSPADSEQAHSEVTQPAPSVETPHPGGDPVPLDRLGTSNLSPDAPEPEPGVRTRMRLTLDQLDSALLDATGFRWTGADDTTSMLDVLAGTLGKPDYIQSTIEDVTPSLLFHKFLDDAARSVCMKLVEADVARTAEERIFLTAVDPDAPLSDPTGTDETLSNALLRFHGRYVTPGAPRLDAWRWLLEHTPADEDPLLPWANLCVGLISHPDFYTY